MRPELTGQGAGYRFVAAILRHAYQQFWSAQQRMTVATFNERAMHLYEKFGFEPLEAPMGNTGHHACNGWYAKEL